MRRSTEPGTTEPRQGAALPRRTLLATLAAAGCSPRIVPAGPPVGPPVDAGDALMMADGVRLPLRSWKPEGVARGVILALHGFNDYSRAFEIPSPLFTDAGWTLYAYDQRGFGGTPSRGLWPGADTLADDAVTAATLIRARHPSLPLILLGESMGGAVLLLAGSRASPPPADGYVLSAPAVWGGETMGDTGRWFLNVFAHTVPALGIVGGSPFIRASDNEAALIALGRDPLVLRSTRVDAIFGLVALMDAALEASRRFDHPALVLYGARDDIVPERAIDALRERLPGLADGRQRIVGYEQGYHLLLRDSGRVKVAEDILAWAEGGAAAAPTPA
ncbi:alpha/beta fold hydrolase [Elioraea rosea]|uniref:alpha/beta fold hydrolase n=1 Tax=Elioraea rosea TaxID=2492390 RepID=UPI0013152015|nr:alpha/beta fold hydrolase [Elioraea rosea]